MSGTIDRAAYSNLLGTNRMLTQKIADRDATIARLEAEVATFTATVDYLTADYTRCCTEKEALKAEVERLRAALELIDSVSIHSSGDIHGIPPKAWEAGFMEVQAMTRAALTQEKTDV